MAALPPRIMVLVGDGWSGKLPEIPAWVYRHTARQNGSTVPTSEWTWEETRVLNCLEDADWAVRTALEFGRLGIVLISGEEFNARAFCNWMLQFMVAQQAALPIFVYEVRVPRVFLIVQPDGSWQPYPGDPEPRR